MDVFNYLAKRLLGDGTGNVNTSKLLEDIWIYAHSVVGVIWVENLTNDAKNYVPSAGMSDGPPL